ncbi:DsbA family protein [Ruania albidiflava]|uniref:DsbA family protein n=1 Tax=Ruania albidiflava TaxID=366586 RepID=UPI0003B51EAC|nr:thioredoxin domain-containing protein [Ruania albidiflava]
MARRTATKGSRPAGTGKGTSANRAGHTGADRKRSERLAKAAREGSRRTGRLTLTIVAAVVLVLVAVSVVVFVQAAQRTYIDELDSVPEHSNRHGGIEVGAQGVAGQVDPDLPVLDVYVDFMSPESAQFFAANGRDLNELRDSGEVTVSYHPVALVDPGAAGASRRAAQAAIVVAHYEPDLFAPFVGALLGTQGQEMRTLGDRELAALALETGVSQHTVDSFTDAMFPGWVAAATNQMRRDTDAGTTPLVRLDGSTLEASWQQEGALRAAVVAELE